MKDSENKEMKMQKMYMLYLYFIINKKEKTEKTENKKQQKYFLIPPITETFFNIEFNKYINLIDKDYLENRNISIEKYLRHRVRLSIPSKYIGYRMGKIVNIYYKFVYIIFYTLKKKYNVKITDSFLYMVYLETNIPPAVLVFVQLHTYKWFKELSEREKKGYSFDEYFERKPEYKEMLMKIEKYLPKGEL